MILLEAQDRSLWNGDLVAEGLALTRRALATERPGPYSFQAAIAAVHAESRVPSETDWSRIVQLYDRLLAVQPSPVIELNRAVGVAMRDGPEAGLSLVDALLKSSLRDYGLAHATRADFCRRLGRNDEAVAAYHQALALTTLEPERRFLMGRIEEMGFRNVE